MRPERAARGPCARQTAHGASYAAVALAAVLAAGGLAGCGGSRAAPQHTGGVSSSTVTATSTAPPHTAAQGPAAQWASGLCAALAAWEASVRVQVAQPGATPTVAGQSPSE